MWETRAGASCSPSHNNQEKRKVSLIGFGGLAGWCVMLAAWYAFDVSGVIRFMLDCSVTYVANEIKTSKRNFTKCELIVACIGINRLLVVGVKLKVQSKIISLLSYKFEQVCLT